MKKKEQLYTSRKPYTTKKKVKKTFYTISTIVFDDLNLIQEQMEHWIEAGTLNENTKIYEVTGEIPWKVQPRIAIRNRRKEVR